MLRVMPLVTSIALTDNLILAGLTDVWRLAIVKEMPWSGCTPVTPG